MNNFNKIKGLTTIPLALLITGAIDSIRNLPATALFGTSLIFFFILSAIVFLIPTALVSAELSANAKEKNGIYYWVTDALGSKMGLIAVWLQWINTLVWFPTILSFIAGTAIYFIKPELAQNKYYLISVILTLFWGLTYLNLKGFHTSAKFANFCTLIGMIIPMLLIIALAIAWVMLGNPIQIHFTAENLFPSLQHTENWISLTAIMSSFLGIELATVHIKEVHQAQTTLPKALSISVLIILTTMILGSLAIAIVLPQNQINLVAGVMQAFSNFFHAYHLSWLLPVITLMVLIGSVGSMISWIISPAKSLLYAANDGFLPTLFTKKNKHGVAQNLLITQAIIVSIVCLAFLLMPSVNGSYWLLTDLSTQLYILMYIIMFISAISLKFKNNFSTKNAVILGGKKSLLLTCGLGLIGCLMTFIIGFIPPDGINVASTLHYELVFGFGLIFMIIPSGVLLFFKNKTNVFMNAQ